MCLQKIATPQKDYEEHKMEEHIGEKDSVFTFRKGTGEFQKSDNEEEESNHIKSESFDSIEERKIIPRKPNSEKQDANPEPIDGVKKEEIMKRLFKSN